MSILVTSDQRGIYNNSPDGMSTTTGFAVALGDLICVMFGAQPGSGAPTCADLIGNSYGPASLLIANGFSNYIWAWLITSAGAHAANLITITHDATAYQQTAAFGINPGTDGAIDVSINATDFFVAAITAGPFTTTTADQVAMMMAYDHFNDNHPFTPGTQDGGYTAAGGIDGVGGFAQYNIFSGIKTATSATITASMSFPVAALITVSVTPGGGGGGPTYTIECETGSFSLSGNALGIKAHRKISLAQGTYSLAGQAVGIKAHRKIALAQGSFSLTGRPLGILAHRKISIAQGTYSSTGYALGIRAHRKIALAQGTYSLVGKAVGIVGSFHISCGTGSYSMTGFDVAILKIIRISLETGIFSMTGNPIGIKAHRKISLGTGTFSMAGQAMRILCRRRISMVGGSYALTGEPMSIKASRRIAMQTGTYVLTGFSIALNFSALVVATPDGRIYSIPRDRRVLSLSSDNRTYRVTDPE